MLCSVPEGQLVCQLPMFRCAGEETDNQPSPGSQRRPEDQPFNPARPRQFAEQPGGEPNGGKGAEGMDHAVKEIAQKANNILKDAK